MNDKSKDNSFGIYFNSFTPLCTTLHGQAAIERFNLPRFIDGSCRREPDLQSKYPSITALCRAEKFAPRLYPDDIVVYVTKKDYYNAPRKHWKIVAVLRVLERFYSHEDAAEWYREKGLPLPANCMVIENQPSAFNQTIGLDGLKCMEDWDEGYWKRARNCGIFLVCEAEFVELSLPPILTDEDMKRIFGKAPSTQNPSTTTEDQFADLKEIINRQSKLGF